MTTISDSAVQQIISRLDALAQKLGVAAANLWAIYVRQASVEAATDGFTALAYVAGAFISFRMCKFCYRKGREDCADEVAWGLGTVGCAAGVIVFSIIAVTFAGAAIAEWINPQFWAIHQLLSDLH